MYSTEQGVALEMEIVELKAERSVMSLKVLSYSFVYMYIFRLYYITCCMQSMSFKLLLILEDVI